MLGGLVCGPKPRTKRVQKNIKRNVVQTVYSRNKPQSALFSMFRRANTQVALRERTPRVPSAHILHKGWVRKTMAGVRRAMDRVSKQVDVRRLKLTPRPHSQLTPRPHSQFRWESGQRHGYGEAVPGAAGGWCPLVWSPSQRSAHVRTVCWWPHGGLGDAVSSRSVGSGYVDTWAGAVSVALSGMLLR